MNEDLTHKDAIKLIEKLSDRIKYLEREVKDLSLRMELIEDELLYIQIVKKNDENVGNVGGCY